MNVTEAATVLSVPLKTVYYWLSKGTLQGQQSSDGWTIRAEDLDAFLQSPTWRYRQTGHRGPIDWRKKRPVFVQPADVALSPELQTWWLQLEGKPVAVYHQRAQRDETPEPQPRVPSGMLTARQVAERLGVKKKRVLDWLKRGILDGQRIAGDLSDWGVPEASVNEFVRRTFSGELHGLIRITKQR